MTPQEVYRIYHDGENKADWRLRVFPNKYPVVEPVFNDEPGKTDELYQHKTAFGYHEVLVETNRHEDTFYSLEEVDFRHIFRAYRERIVELKKLKKIRHVQVIKNHGTHSGASLEHGHSQLFATELVPDEVQQRYDTAEEYFGRTRSCIMCDYLKKEMSSRERTVWQNESFAVLEAYAPRFAYETIIVPRRHNSHFETISDNEIAELAQTMKKLMKALGSVSGNAGFNMLLHSGPIKTKTNSFHWSIEILPMITKMAGYERATGFYLNPITPEEAATNLKTLIS